MKTPEELATEAALEDIAEARAFFIEKKDPHITIEFLLSMRKEFLLKGMKLEREEMLSNLEKLYSELEFDGPFQDDLFRREIIEELRDWLKGRVKK